MTNTSDDTFKKLINSAAIYDRSQIEWYTKFNRFGCLDPFNNVTHTREYIFFTKPDLHILDGSSSTAILNPELKGIPLWEDAFKRYYDVLLQLQYSANSPKNVFVNLLSNSVKISLDLPTINANEIETSENIYGTHMTYRRSSITTDEQFDFSLEFEDTKYLEVYMWFRLFDEYCKLKDLGMVSPVNQNYIINKWLHDQMSVYKFIVGEDGETLLYWAKLWGVFPKGAPREAFSDLTTLTSGLRLNVSFKAQFVDDMDPTILADLNTSTLDNLQLPAASQILPLYDKDICAVSGEWAGLPFVVKDSKVINTNAIYKLKWRRI